MKVWDRLMYALDAWKTYGYATEVDYAQTRYAERWALYTGTAFETALRQFGPRQTPAYRRLYRNTRLTWKHIEAVVDFYETHVYMGQVTTDGKPLPNGTMGAIPIDPQVGSDAAEAILRTGIAELLASWNWQAQMSDRPRYVAALGDSMTRLVDDNGRGAVYPETIWPGYVKSVTLDEKENVKAYTLEYQVTEEDERGRSETFTYREEVDKESYRYFKNDRPWDRFGDGAVVSNPYGFVPAIWDRFRKMPNSERGAAATDGTRQAVLEINGFLSHAIDHQRKLFYAPVIVQGAQMGGRAKVGGVVDLTTPPSAASAATESARDRAAMDLAETFPIWRMNDNAGVHQVSFDVADSLALITELKEGIYAENPEARFFPELRQMSQLTAPGAERALGDAVQRVKRLRDRLDPNTVKLIQMALAIAGYRVNLAPNLGGWPRPLTQHQQAYVPFGLDSFKSGLLDFTIMDRPVIPESESERLDLLIKKQDLGIPDEALWLEMGVDEVDIAGWKAIKQQKADQQRRIFDRGDVAPGFDATATE